MAEERALEGGRVALRSKSDNPIREATDMAASQFTLTFHTYRAHTAVLATHRSTAGAVESRKRVLSVDLPLGLDGLEEMRPDEVLSALVSALNARLQ